MKLPRRQLLHLAAGAAALPAAPRIARAQAYPVRPIRLVIPFPPGGAFDSLGRPWADRLKPLLGTVVVENIGGGGETNHLTGELLTMLAGTPEIVQVPYRGMGPAMTDLISGQLAMAVPAVTGQVLEFHRSGKMRVLAVTSPKRLTGAPELPTA